MMVVPPLATINALIKAKDWKRLDQIDAEYERQIRQDSRTIADDRGPVRK